MGGVVINGGGWRVVRHCRWCGRWGLLVMDRGVFIHLFVQPWWSRNIV